MAESLTDIFLKEIDDTSLIASIVGCWRKYSKIGNEPAIYTEVDMIKFNADGTGVWRQYDDTGFLESLEDKFNYRVEGHRLILSYTSFPEQFEVREYRVADGHLILVDDYGMPNAVMEVYDQFLPQKQKKWRTKKQQIENNEK